MSFFISIQGQYLGQISNGKKDILVVSEDASLVNSERLDELPEKERRQLESPSLSTPLIGSSESDPGYQYPILITEATWDIIQKAGGHRPDPFLVNNSTTTVFIKPEGKLLEGPGKISDHKTPIAVPSGKMVYGRIDGVNTPFNGQKVFKVVDGNRLIVLPSGEIKVVSYQNIKSMFGQWWKGGWKDLGRRSSWIALTNVFHPANDHSNNSG